jgi:hypothetical protein
VRRGTSSISGSAPRHPNRPLWLTALILIVGVAAYLMSPRGGQGPGALPPIANPSAARDAAPLPRSTPAPAQARPVPGRNAGQPTDGGIAALFREKTSDRWVEAEGRVERTLDDDAHTADGSDKHQRFLVKLDTGVTVLVAHNIDAARRVPVERGDPVRFRGEYEWTEKGGTVHFTHAPKFKRRDPGGWIEHRGVRYE